LTESPWFHDLLRLPVVFVRIPEGTVLLQPKSLTFEIEHLEIV
jgi:hypothetical protein